LSHFCLYYYVAQRREYGKQTFNIIGVDIDGVLNNQRKHFSQFLQKNCNKKINPIDIIFLPVRDCPNLNITKENEISVFNDPKYWIDMPANENAKEVLNSLQKSFNLHIHIFTNRAWPILPKRVSRSEKKKIIQYWKTERKIFQKVTYTNETLVNRLNRYGKRILKFFPYRIKKIRMIFKKQTELEKITQIWLDKFEIPHDKLLVELGNEDVSDLSTYVYNRFYAAKKMPIKYFVEDDLKKAQKLSYICDYVFLIDQPYNKENNLPENVIRVEAWEEILQIIRGIV
jgi:uncharacterized HAD superfamily protein